MRRRVFEKVVKHCLTNNRTQRIGRSVPPCVTCDVKQSYRLGNHSGNFSIASVGIRYVGNGNGLAFCMKFGKFWNKLGQVAIDVLLVGNTANAVCLADIQTAKVQHLSNRQIAKQINVGVVFFGNRAPCAFYLCSYTLVHRPVLEQRNNVPALRSGIDGTNLGWVTFYSCQHSGKQRQSALVRTGINVNIDIVVSKTFFYNALVKRSVAVWVRIVLQNDKLVYYVADKFKHFGKHLDVYTTSVSVIFNYWLWYV